MDGSFHIGPWLVEPSVNTVSRNGTPVHLEPKMMSVLVCLAKAKNTVVSKERLIDEVWKDTFVTDDVLTRCISELRKALEDDTKEPHIIQTIPKRGYRLIADVISGPPSVPGGRLTSIVRSRWWLAGTLITLVAALIYVTVFRSRTRNGSPSGPVTNGERPTLKTVRLTHSGQVAGGQVAISPDGKLLYYVYAENGRNSIRIRQLSSGSEVTVLPPTENAIGGIVVTPKGEDLYFREKVGDGGLADLKLMPALGGAPRPVAKGIVGSVGVSPDGSRIAFLRLRERAGAWDLVIANADGSEERILRSRVEPQEYNFRGFLSWSPDGKTIAIPAADSRGEKSELVAVDVASGNERSLTSHVWPQWGLGDVAWLPDGSGLIVNARDRGENMQIWHVQEPSGESRRLTSDASAYYTVSLSADGNNIVTTQYSVSTTIWTSDYRYPNRARQVTFLPRARDGLGTGPAGISWLGTDKLVFTSGPGTAADLWLLDLRAGERRRLTDHPGQDFFPIASPDGKYIYYSSAKTGQPNIWRIDADGTNPLQLTYSTTGVYDHHLSPDGKNLTYTNQEKGQIRPLRMPSAGGNSEVVLDAEVSPDGAPVYSFDGKRIMVPTIVSQEHGPELRQTVIIDVQSGAHLQTMNGEFYSFTPDGTGLIFVGKYKGTNNLMVRPLGKGAPYPLTTLSNEEAYAFAISSDGKQLAVVRAKDESDAVLISDFH